MVNSSQRLNKSQRNAIKSARKDSTRFIESGTLKNLNRLKTVAKRRERV